MGYILAAPCTAAFADAYPAYLAQLPASLATPPPPCASSASASDASDASALQAKLLRALHDPAALLHSAFPALLRDYPAHMHVDILADFQGQGWGARLLAALEERLRGMGVRGLHLGMDGKNKGAERFYRRAGFERFGEVMDGGVSGEVGRLGGGGLVMCKRL